MQLNIINPKYPENIVTLRKYFKKWNKFTKNIEYNPYKQFYIDYNNQKYDYAEDCDYISYRYNQNYDDDDYTNNYVNNHYDESYNESRYNYYNRYDENDYNENDYDNEFMYGGISDDWESYRDSIYG